MQWKRAFESSTAPAFCIVKTFSRADFSSKESLKKHGKAHGHKTNSESEKVRVLNSLTLDDNQRMTTTNEVTVFKKFGMNSA
jgi:hypothetical protein